MAKSLEIDSSVEAWENRKLGCDEDYVEAVSLDDMIVDEEFGLQPISIRMRKQLIKDLKIIAEHNSIGYQTLMKQILERFAQAELREMARALVSSQRERELQDKDLSDCDSNVA